MLVLILAVFAVSWALWFAYLVRYPARWRSLVDRQHEFLAHFRLSSGWMREREKGNTLRVIVGATTLLSLMCIVILLKYPHALDYLRK
jgi:hypothetical protein